MTTEYTKIFTGLVEIKGDYESDSARRDINAADGELSTTATGPFEFLNVNVKLDNASNTTITVEIDSIAGVTYDTVLRSKTLSAQQNFVFVAPGLILVTGDQIKVTVATEAANYANIVIRRKDIVEVG